MSIADRINSWLNYGESLKLTCEYRLQVSELDLKPNNITLIWNITNTGRSPAYIDSVGFRTHEYSFAKGAVYPLPRLSLELLPVSCKSFQPFPVKLDPRCSIQITMRDGNQLEEARYHNYMYVSTTLGYSKAVRLPFPKDEVFSSPRRKYYHH